MSAREGEGVKQKRTPADMGEGGQAIVDVHIWLKFDKLNGGNMAAINSYNSNRLSQLREQYTMSGAVYWKSYLVDLWTFRTG